MNNYRVVKTTDDVHHNSNKSQLTFFRELMWGISNNTP